MNKICSICQKETTEYYICISNGKEQYECKDDHGNKPYKSVNEKQPTRKITTQSVFIADDPTIDLEELKSEISENVVSISIRRCDIVNVPPDFFESFKYLEDIDLYANMIEVVDFIVPDRVTNVILSHNRIHTINTVFPARTEYIDLYANYLKNIPESVENFRVNFGFNEIPEYLLRGRELRENRIRNKDQTNVHNTVIAENVRKAIEFLMEESFKITKKEPKYYNEILEFYDYYKRKESMNIVLKICRSPEYYKMNELLKLYTSFENVIVYDYDTYKECKLRDLIERVWSYAKNKFNNETRKSIIENLYLQMEDGREYCFVGKFSRVVNTLTSFVDEITNDISVNDKISNKIIELQDKNITKEEIKEIITKFMDHLDLEEHEQEPWLDAIDEM